MTAAVVYAAAIFVSGSVPAGAPGAGVNDKVLHAIAFAVQCALLATALRRRLPARRARLWVSGAVAVGLGALLELWQALLPHRSAELGDLLADAVGAAAAALVLGARGRGLS